MTAAAIAVTVAATSIGVWIIAKHELYSQLDRSLVLQSQGGGGPFGGGSNLTLHVHEDGDATGNPAIPYTTRARRVAAGKESGYFASTSIQGVAVREVVIPD